MLASSTVSTGFAWGRTFSGYNKSEQKNSSTGRQIKPLLIQNEQEVASSESKQSKRRHPFNAIVEIEEILRRSTQFLKNYDEKIGAIDIEIEGVVDDREERDLGAMRTALFKIAKLIAAHLEQLSPGEREELEKKKLELEIEASQARVLMIRPEAASIFSGWFVSAEKSPEEVARVLAFSLRAYPHLTLDAIDFVYLLPRSLEELEAIFDALLSDLINAEQYEMALKIVSNIDFIRVQARANVSIGARLKKEKMIKEGIASLHQLDEPEKIETMIRIVFELIDTKHLHLAYNTAFLIATLWIRYTLVLEIARRFRESEQSKICQEVVNDVVKNWDEIPQGGIRFSLPLGIELKQLLDPRAKEFIDQARAAVTANPKLLKKALFLLIEGDCCDEVPQFISDLSKKEREEILDEVGRQCLRMGIPIEKLTTTAALNCHELIVLEILAAQRKREFSYAERRLDSLVSEEVLDTSEEFRKAVFNQLHSLPPEKISHYINTADFLISQMAEGEAKSKYQQGLVHYTLITERWRYQALTIASRITDPKIQTDTYCMIIRDRSNKGDHGCISSVLELMFNQIFMRAPELQSQLTRRVVKRLRNHGGTDLLREKLLSRTFEKIKGFLPKEKDPERA